jgi:erythromycin esterase-like protein
MGVYSQNKLKQFIIDNSTEINSINIADTNYSDLETFGRAVEDCRVVMLGEMWHGDGATFEAKARLIRYLHEKHRFNVLAFESDFYSLNKPIDLIVSEKIHFDSLASQNIFPHWAKSKQCQPLFEYLKSKNEFTLSGIDNQLNGEICKDYLKKDFSEYFKKSEINYLNSDFYKNRFWPCFDTMLTVFTKSSWKGIVKYSAGMLKTYINALDSITIQIDQKGLKDLSFQHQSLKSYTALCKMYYIAVNLKDYSASSTLRDKQMADNLEWLVNEKFQDEKIIVWLASSHMVKNNQEAYKNPAKEISMGYFYSQKNSIPKTYYVGFTSHNGRGNYLGNTWYKIPKSKSGSIESAFNKSGKLYQFVSLKNYVPDKNEMYIYGKVDAANNFKAHWYNCVDGIFYIKTMTPSSRR